MASGSFSEPWVAFLALADPRLEKGLPKPSRFCLAVCFPLSIPLSSK